MRSPSTVPSAVPSFDVTVHIVLDDFGKIGRAYRETDEEQADLETVVEYLLAGEYSKPLRIVAFNTAEGWARDVSEDVAWEVLARGAKKGNVLSDSARQFVIFHVGEHEVEMAEVGLL